MNVAAMKTAAFDKVGLPGIVGIGLLLFCLAFYVGTISPAHDELARLEGEKARLAATAKPGGTVAARDTTSAGLPPISEAPELLKKLNALAARHGMAVERSSYQIKGKDGPRRLEVDLPLKVAYPSLRAFLREALVLTPTAALEDLNLQRTQAAEPVVEAQLRLSFAFAAAP